MRGFSGWRVRSGAGARLSDGLVIQAPSPGRLELSVCRVAGRRQSPARVGFLGPVVAACTSEGIRRDTGIVSWLHWPNLVTIDGRVVASTSISVRERQKSGVGVVFGISVNCFARSRSASPSELPSTSIRDALGVRIDIDMLRDKILHALDWYYAEWERGMRLKLVERIQPTISWLGSAVTVKTADGQVLEGMARGLDEEGSLLLEASSRRARAKTLALRPDGVALVLAK